MGHQQKAPECASVCLLARKTERKADVALKGGGVYKHSEHYEVGILISNQGKAP